MSKNKIKHSKIRNTGILFEILTRQLTLEVINGDVNEHAKHIIKKFFKAGTELNKELRLYQLLSNANYSSESTADKFIDTVCERVSKLNTSVLNREKYTLIKEISERFNVDSLLSSPIANYKLFASIYKLFESKKTEYDNVEDIFSSRITVLENITNTKHNRQPITEQMQVVDEYKQLDEDVRILAYKILLESFNSKYKSLDEKQSALLRGYINDVTNTSNFKNYYLSEVASAVSELRSLYTNISDKVTAIKLNETVSMLNKITVDKRVSDAQVSSLMMTYELIKELKSK